MKLVSAFVVLWASAAHAQQLGTDYLAQVPPTIYEDQTVSPQNGDFDKVNNMFVAHPGWYNDKEIHYYKFRIYAPATYEGVITPNSTAADVPIQPIYFMTTTGNITGTVGSPVIPYHTSDGVNYSDFMEVHFVTVTADYVADTFKSEGDIQNSMSVATGETMGITPSGIILNLPVVPTNSTLQHPHKGGNSVAPIAPVVVWYKGNQVTTYLFEVTDQAAADYFAHTRTENATDYAFAIPVVADFASANAVRSIPLWFFNQFSRGVTQGVNNGGPNPMGMRNIIGLDRADPGYSPLWNLLWLTEVPINYSADDISNAQNVQTEDGFVVFQTPMFVNCPDIGNVGTEVNVPKQAFMTSIDPSLTTNVILGSHQSLLFLDAQPVSFLAGDIKIGSTTTNAMGAYQYELVSSSIPSGASSIDVSSMETTIRMIAVKAGQDTSTSGNGTSTPNTSANGTGSPNASTGGSGNGTVNMNSSARSIAWSTASVVVGFLVGTLLS